MNPSDTKVVQLLVKAPILNAYSRNAATPKESQNAPNALHYWNSPMERHVNVCFIRGVITVGLTSEYTGRYITGPGQYITEARFAIQTQFYCDSLTLTTII